jgi:hypothetical protein
MSELNTYFGIGCFLINGISGDNYEDLLSDMDDGYKVSYFIRKYPGLHNIQFEASSHNEEFYSASVEFSDYENWSDEMKDFWAYSKESQWEKDYQIKSIENGFNTIRCRYGYDSIEMKSLLINPIDFPAQ